MNPKLLDTVFQLTKEGFENSLSHFKSFNGQISFDKCFTQERLPLDLPRFPNKPKGSSDRGIYMYNHIDDAEFENIRYVGKGHILQRKDRCTRVFKNGGNACVSVNGASSDCRVANKMREEDSKLGNWMIWFIRMPAFGTKESQDIWTNHLEINMHLCYNPKYNLPGMLGQ